MTSDNDNECNCPTGGFKVKEDGSTYTNDMEYVYRIWQHSTKIIDAVTEQIQPKCLHEGLLPLELAILRSIAHSTIVSPEGFKKDFDQMVADAAKNLTANADFVWDSVLQHYTEETRN